MKRRYYFQGHRVSRGWYIILASAWKAGIRFRLNDGKRTIADQWARVRKHGLYNAATNPHGAARPLPGAPHIKYGKQNHALDVDTIAYGDGEDALQLWCHRHGLSSLVNNVTTEAWHLDPTNWSQFLAVARQLAKRYKIDPKDGRKK